MLESQVQSKIIKYIKETIVNSEIIKFTVVNKIWLPDLLVLVWDGKCFFIETKQIKGKLSKIQQYKIKLLRDIWYTVLVPYSYEEFLEQFTFLKL